MSEPIPPIDIDMEAVAAAEAARNQVASLAQYERLHATADVTVWAKEWVSTAALILARNNNDSLALLDEGWMIGWFANYAQAVNDLLHQQRVEKGVHPGTWHAFLYFYHLDCSNAAFHTADVRFSPITFRLAEFIMSEYSVVFAIQPDARLHEVFSALGKYEEDRGRAAEAPLR
jgi:hypothetical protein